jgi:hypothetical protein
MNRAREALEEVPERLQFSGLERHCGSLESIGHEALEGLSCDEGTIDASEIHDFLVCEWWQ